MLKEKKQRREQHLEQALIQKTLALYVGSERDSVRAYNLYASKRPDDMKNPDSPFYLAINQSHYKSRKYKTLVQVSSHGFVLGLFYIRVIFFWVGS